MNFIIKTTCFWIIMPVVFWACDSADQYVSPYEEYPKAGLVKADIHEESLTLNLFGDLAAQSITFDLTPYDDSGNDGEFIEKLDILSIYTSPSGALTSDTVLISTETTLANATVSYSVQQLVDSFDELTALSDIQGGDNFTFIFQTTMTDGRVFHPDNIAPSICGAPNARGTCTFTIPVVCPSDIPEGVYEGTSEGFGLTTVKDVTLTKTGDFIYNLSDLSAGLLGVLIEDPTYDGGGQIEDFCNLINVPTFNPPTLVAVSQVTGDFGSYNADTGVIIIKWSIVGTSVITTLVPK